MKRMLKHWDYVLGGFGTVITLISKDDVAIVVGVLTAMILLPRAVIWWIRLWQTWRDRNKRWKGHE